MPSLRRMVTVRVPATSANMGPGFDCLGMALNVYNDLTVRTDVDKFIMTIEGEGAADLPRHEDNLVMRGIKLAFREAGITTLPPLSVHMMNRIPIGAGLGSSSAAIVAGLLAGLALTDTRLAVEHEEKALQLAATVEGHVDNLAPCIYGGMQIGVHTGSRWYTTGVSVPQGMQCVLFIPELRQETEACRAILPKEVSRVDAVFNIGRASLLVNAFASGNLDDLAHATQDALHQPIRSGIMPALAPCIAAALAAGAKGAFLSGAGSSIMALTSGRKGDIYGQADRERRDIEVARAMQRAAAAIGMKGKILITNPAATGAHVTCIDDDQGLVISGRALGVVPADMTSDDFHPSSSVGGRDGSAPSPRVNVPATAHVPAAEVPTSNGAASAPAATAAGASSIIGSGTGSSSIRYVSTRSGAAGGSISFTEAVFAGVAPDGGLYVPSSLPSVSKDEILLWWASGASYADVAFGVLSKFIGDADIPAAELRGLVDAAYRPVHGVPGLLGAPDLPGGGTWDTPAIAPLVQLQVPSSSSTGSSGDSAPPAPPSIALLEQFHGPTCAFKDHALQLLGHLFSHLLAAKAAKGAKDAASTNGGAASSGRMTILGATSGDTGSAAIAGLRGKPGVDVFILHPAGRIAAVQEMQMTSVLDANVHNLAVAGSTFDDCQTMVKEAFGDEAFRSRHSLSAINSINWARVLAQSVYYFWAYIQHLGAPGGPFAAWGAPQRNALASALRSPGSPFSRNATARLSLPPVTFVVPTGNFGNALSGHYARSVGLPIGRIVVATNANDIVHRFIASGDYSRSGPVAATLAPSMDIQLASNLERYLYHVSGGDAERVRAWQAEATGPGRAITSFPPELLAQLQADFGSSTTDDATINDVIARYLQHDSETGAVTGGYALCPHTACGVHAAEQLLASSGSQPQQQGTIIVLATAHPAKFAADTPALSGLYGEVFTGASEPRLAALAAVATPATVRPPVPEQLAGIASAPRQAIRVRCDVAEVKRVVDAIAR